MEKRKRIDMFKFVKQWVLSVIIVLLPFIMTGIILIFNGYKIHFTMLLSAWNDEVGWWSQVDSMIQYGRPLGYYGYNGTFAKVGTWGPWGGAPILPYAFFGKIFGWKLYSMAFANMTFLSVALLIFLLTTKPNQIQKIWICVVYCCFTITIGYSMTSMSEGLRYSFGIILTGLLIWFERKTNKEIAQKDIGFSIKDTFIYLIIMMFVYYAVLVYLIFSLIVPIFCFFFFRKRKPLICIGISFVVTVIVAVSANYFVSISSAPYVTSTIGTIVEVMKKKGFYRGFCFVLDSFFNNLATVNLPNLLKMDSILFWFFLLYLIVLCYLSKVILSLFKTMIPLSKERKQERFSTDNNYCYFCALWMMMGFLFGYCMLYTGGTWTLCRGINTGLVMAFLLLIFAESTDDRKILIAVSLLGIVSIRGYYRQLIDERAFVAQYADIIMDEKKKLEEIIDISEENTVWENTIAHYGFVNYMYLSLPTGAGLNYMLDGGVNENAKYALITSGDGGKEVYRQLLIDAGHSVIYEDEYFIVLLNLEKEDS